METIELLDSDSGNEPEWDIEQRQRSKSSDDDIRLDPSGLSHRIMSNGRSIISRDEAIKMTKSLETSDRQPRLMQHSRDSLNDLSTHSDSTITRDTTESTKGKSPLVQITLLDSDSSECFDAPTNLTVEQQHLTFKHDKGNSTGINNYFSPSNDQNKIQGRNRTSRSSLQGDHRLDKDKKVVQKNVNIGSSNDDNDSQGSYRESRIKAGQEQTFKNNQKVILNNEPFNDNDRSSRKPAITRSKPNSNRLQSYSDTQSESDSDSSEYIPDSRSSNRIKQSNAKRKASQRQTNKDSPIDFKKDWSQNKNMGRSRRVSTKKSLVESSLEMKMRMEKSRRIDIDSDSSKNANHHSAHSSLKVGHQQSLNNRMDTDTNSSDHNINSRSRTMSIASIPKANYQQKWKKHNNIRIDSDFDSSDIDRASIGRTGTSQSSAGTDYRQTYKVEQISKKKNLGQRFNSGSETSDNHNNLSQGRRTPSTHSKLTSDHKNHDTENDSSGYDSNAGERKLATKPNIEGSHPQILKNTRRITHTTQPNLRVNEQQILKEDRDRDVRRLDIHSDLSENDCNPPMVRCFMAQANQNNDERHLRFGNGTVASSFPGTRPLTTPPDLNSKHRRSPKINGDYMDSSDNNNQGGSCATESQMIKNKKDFIIDIDSNSSDHTSHSRYADMKLDNQYKPKTQKSAFRDDALKPKSTAANTKKLQPHPRPLLILSSSDDEVESANMTYTLAKKSPTTDVPSTSINSNVPTSERRSAISFVTAQPATMETIELSDSSDTDESHKNHKVSTIKAPSVSEILIDAQSSQQTSHKLNKRKLTLVDSTDSDDSVFQFQNPFSKQKDTDKFEDLEGSFSSVQASRNGAQKFRKKWAEAEDLQSRTELTVDMEDHDQSNESLTQESSILSDVGARLQSISYRSEQIASQSSLQSNSVIPSSNTLDDVPTPILPSVNEISGRLYPDIRHQCIKALISHAKVLRRAIHNRGSLDTSIRAIIVFTFYPYPIRSPEAAANLKGVGSELLAVFKEMMTHCAKEKKQPYCPPRGKFSSVAAASIIALSEYEREHGGKHMCSMENLITRINTICHNPCAATLVLDRDVEYYLNKENIDPGWLQIRKLCAGNQSIGLEALIKERKSKSLCTSGIGFELTDLGRRQADVLRQIASAEPVPPGPLRQLASNFVDKAYGSVTMSMDMREGGGYTKSLHKLCNLLDEYRVPYVVRTLKISDYVFFVGNKLAPILIERKSVDDVAGSLNDGRWERQQRNMRKAQYVLGNGEQRKCQICYIIEGEAAKRLVHGGVVARTSWDISLEEVEKAISSLPKLGFSVMKSKSHMGTMNILSQVARDISWKYRNGSIDCSLTYEEFVREMARCPEELGDPPTRPELMNPLAPVVDSVSTVVREQATSDIMNSHRRTVSSPSSNQDGSLGNDQNERYSALEKLSLAELKELCVDRNEKISGSKKDLIDRLLQERKPEILLTRARRNQYVPKVPSSNAALLVALLLNHTPGTEGLSKERLMLLAEETGVSKDPMGGKGGWYDGWSGMKEMTSGDPPLVSVIKKKYSLTTQPFGGAGVDVATALHILAHRQSICRCGTLRL